MRSIRELAKSDADAGYAVDELTGLLGKIPADGFAVLPADGSRDGRPWP